MKVLHGIAGVMFIVSLICAGLLHLFCCYIAFMAWSFWGAVATFCFPGVANIYWAISSCVTAGGLTPFALATIAVAVALLISKIVFAFTDK